MSGINFIQNFSKSQNDVTKLKQVGPIYSSVQKDSPKSAGARGLNKIHDFAFKKPNDMMKKNEQEGWRQNTLEDIKVVLTKIDSILK